MLRPLLQYDCSKSFAGSARAVYKHLNYLEFTMRGQADRSNFDFCSINAAEMLQQRRLDRCLCPDPPE